jgi:ankyrin repeat protein
MPANNMAQEFDRDGDGMLSQDELLQGMHRRGIVMANSHAARIMEEADTNHDGMLSQEEINHSPTLVKLYASVAKHDVQSVMTLLYSEPIELSHQDGNGQTLLHQAARVGSTLCVALLLEKDKTKEALFLFDKQGHTPLEIAILNQHKECSYLLAKKVLEVGAELCPTQITAPGTPAKKHKKKPAASPKRKNSLGGKFAVQGGVDDDPEHADVHAAVRANNTQEVMMLLYGKNIDVATANSKGETLLHSACRVGSTLSVALLLEKENSMRAIVVRDHEGNTPLEVAIQHDHKECAYVLAKKIMQLITNSAGGSKACIVM